MTESVLKESSARREFRVSITLLGDILRRDTIIRFCKDKKMVAQLVTGLFGLLDSVVGTKRGLVLVFDSSKLWRRARWLFWELSAESSGYQVPEGSVGGCALSILEAYGCEGSEGSCMPPREACRVSSGQDFSSFVVFLHGRFSYWLWPPVLYLIQRFEQGSVYE